jgi:hypothetical protein
LDDPKAALASRPVDQSIKLRFYASVSAKKPASEARVLAGLRDRLMTPEAAAEAMRAYAAETNRLNR